MMIVSRAKIIIILCKSDYYKEISRCSHNEIYDIGTEILLLTKNDHNSTQKTPKSIPEDFKSAGQFPSSDSVKSRFKALFKKWPSWIRRCCFSWIFAPGGRLNHEAYNVRTIVFMISKNTIPYIGTEILYETCDGHNSTQNAPKSMIPVRVCTDFCVDSESAIKTRF